MTRTTDHVDAARPVSRQPARAGVSGRRPKPFPGVLVLAGLLACSRVCGAGTNAVPDWRAALASGSGSRVRQVPRTLVYSRAQFMYNPQLNYIGRWTDTPLLLDPSLRDDKPTGQCLSCAAFGKMQETVLSYGMDGFACLPGKHGSAFLYEYCARTPHGGFTLVPEIAGSDGAHGAESNARFDGVILPALASPHALHLNGKLVVSSYGGDAQPPAFWKAVFDAYRRKHGDRFIFLPQLGSPGGRGWGKWQTDYHAGSITTQAVAACKEYLRGYLRCTDGLYLPATAMFPGGERRFDAAFYRDFVVALGRGVLAEPEFKGKYFALTARVGKENCARIGYNLSSYGTETLRLSMEAALSADPDLIIIPEWDEQNENTSLRPTLCNSFAYKRIMRYYTGRTRREAPAPLPGDDVAVPNLIVSFRKTMVLGERLNVELLNVPDTDRKEAYTVRLALKDVDGREVIAFPEAAFNAADLQEHRLTAPSEDFSAHPVLLPSVTVSRRGKVSRYEEGLPHIELRGTWNWDYKWMMQPLRDLLVPAQAGFRFAGDTDGVYTFAADVAADEDLAYVELLDHNATVYTALNPGEPYWRETPGQKVLAFDIQNLFNHEAVLNGTISLKGVGAQWLPDTSYNWPTEYPRPFTGDTYRFAGVRQGLAPQRIYAALPADQAETAVVAVNLPGQFVAEVPVKQILEAGIYGVPGQGVATLTISRFMRQAFQPYQMKGRTASFKAGILPDMPHSIVHLQVVAKSGRTWRSRPILLNRGLADGQRIVTVYSDSKEKPVDVRVPSYLAPDIAYGIDPRCGTALKCEAGRMFWGLGGGYPAQVTERGRSRALDTSAFIQASSYPADAVRSAPAVCLQDGLPAWKFDGEGTHLALPSGVIPRRAGYTLAMDVWPDCDAGQQVLLANRSHVLGSLALFLDNGVLKGDFLRDDAYTVRLDTGLPLPPGRWSKLQICYDLSNIVFRVNGQSRTLACPGPGRYDTPTVVGGFGKSWFRGMIRGLRVKHWIEPGSPAPSP